MYHQVRSFCAGPSNQGRLACDFKARINCHSHFPYKINGVAGWMIPGK